MTLVFRGVSIAMPADNQLDHKLPKNDLAGKGANSRGKTRFKPNPLSGFGKGRDVRVQKNKLAFPPGRHSLVFRSMLDGVKLIEGISKLCVNVQEAASYRSFKFVNGRTACTVSARTSEEAWKKLQRTHAYFSDCSDWKLQKPEAKKTVAENATSVSFWITGNHPSREISEDEAVERGEPQWVVHFPRGSESFDVCVVGDGLSDGDAVDAALEVMKKSHPETLADTDESNAWAERVSE